MFCTNCGHENNDSAKFCSHCGERIGDSIAKTGSSHESAQISNDIKANDLTCFMDAVQVYLSGSVADTVKKKYCEMLKVKSFDKVLCSIYANSDCVVLVPKSKDARAFMVAGMLLGGGAAFSVLFGAIGNAFDKARMASQTSDVQKLFDATRNVLVVNAKTVRLDAKDVRFLWNLGGGDWYTEISITGQSVFNDETGDCRISFQVEGRSNKKTWHAKPNNKVAELSVLLGISQPEIKEEKNFFG